MASFRPLNTPMIRSFSTTAIQDQLVKAPIQVFGLEGRYASALYSAAAKEKKLEAVEKDLISLHKAYSTDKVLKEFLLSPIINKNLKSDAVKSIASKLSLTPYSTNLLDALAENGRLKKLPEVINSFKLMMSATRGDINIEVTCAKELDSAYKQDLETTLRKFAKKSENLMITYKIDPAIIGGLIVSIGDRYVDLSTANKVKKYTDALKSVV